MKKKETETVTTEKSVKTEAKAPVKETVKKAVKKVAKKAPSTVIPSVGPVVETAPKKTETKPKKASASEETFVEFYGGQVNINQIQALVKEAYKAEGHKVSAIKSLRIYINLDERKAYYVINDKPEGKSVAF